MRPLVTLSHSAVWPSIYYVNLKPYYLLSQ